MPFSDVLAICHLQLLSVRRSFGTSAVFGDYLEEGPVEKVVFSCLVLLDVVVVRLDRITFMLAVGLLLAS